MNHDHAARFSGLMARLEDAGIGEWAPRFAIALTFLLLFREPLTGLLEEWWTNPEAGHGLLLGPLAIVLAWRRGIRPDARPQPALGLTLLASAVLLRHLSGLAAELFTMRISMLGAVLALIITFLGLRQLLHWWLPGILLVLSVPLPAVLLGTLSYPLQLEASRMGAALLEARHVPVRLSGNIIQLPGRSLFVTEACSGLRSLTALLSLGVLIGGLWLRSSPGRILLLLAVIPVAMGVNAVRVFLTGFLTYFVSPGLGDGLMHYTEGWALFIVAFAVLGALAWGLGRLERRWSGGGR